MNIQTCLIAILSIVGIVNTADLRIGAFNIQIFGTSKTKKKEVMSILVKIIRRYDVLLIQEIRDASGQAIQDLLKAVNRNEPLKRQFSMKISGRLGRTSSKEQYAFFYREKLGLKIKTYTFNDNFINDPFEREPFIAIFQSSNTVLHEFALAGIHVDPDVAVSEINALYAVFNDPILAAAGITNIMVLGDLNADCRYVSKSKWAKIPLKNDPKYTWLIGDNEDTTVKGSHCAYDRFIYRGSGWDGGVVAGSAKVFRFNNETDVIGPINQKMAEAVSDHFPIEFLLKAEIRLKGSMPLGRISVSGVYVVLEHATVSLPKDVVYEIPDGVNVRDTDNNVVGQLRNKTAYDKELNKQILYFIQKRLISGTLLIQRVRRGYRGQQRMKLMIPVTMKNKPLQMAKLRVSCESRYFICS